MTSVVNLTVNISAMLRWKTAHVFVLFYFSTGDEELDGEDADI